MHAFLLIGGDKNELRKKTDELAEKLGAKIMEFPLTKIEEVRSLSNLIRLSFNEPTLIVCPNINEATTETLNAFLKNLEEPQENVYFALTAGSLKKVLPTIASRCQIIKVQSAKYEAQSSDIEEFVGMKIGGRLLYIDKIKDREKAIYFTENLISTLHENMHSESSNYKKSAENITSCINTLNNLKANGNVSLQLANLIFSLE